MVKKKNVSAAKKKPATTSAKSTAKKKATAPKKTKATSDKKRSTTRNPTAERTTPRKKPEVPGKTTGKRPKTPAKKGKPPTQEKPVRVTTLGDSGKKLDHRGNVAVPDALQGPSSSTVEGGLQCAEVSYRRYEELVRLLNNPTFNEAVQELLASPVEVIVTATMSAGKSTLLNAMLAEELLPFSNQACTARVSRIEDHDGADGFECRTRLGNDATPWIKATHEHLRDLNGSPDAALIELRGDLPYIRNMGARLVLFDTPGPNNACDENHRRVTEDLLKSGGYGLILYLLNAAQIGVNDDATFLDLLAELDKSEDRHKRIVFVLNKADQLDPEKGEDLPEIVQSIEEYLRSHGFAQPRIVPTCAIGAVYARMILRGNSLTRRERGELRYLLSYYRSHKDALLHSANINDQIKRKVSEALNGAADVDRSVNQVFELGNESTDSNELHRFVAFTGLTTLELLLEEYLMKEGLPHTMGSLHELFQSHGAEQLAAWLRS